MAGAGAKATIIATLAAFGGLSAVAIVTTLVIGMIIFALIPIYTPNPTQAGFGSGEEYRINALMLKSLYTNTTYSFVDGAIADNPQLSNLCTLVYKGFGEQNFAGCLIQNMYGWGAFYNDTLNFRRRKRATFGLSSLYSIGQARIFYSTPCTKKSDKGKYSNSTNLSYCVQRRLAACNGLFNSTPTGQLTEWAPVPSAFTYAISNMSYNGYVELNVYKVYGVRPSTAVYWASSIFFNVSLYTQSQLLAGCEYIGPVAKSDITNILAAQYFETTTFQPNITLTFGR